MCVCVCLIGCREASAAVHEDELHVTADDVTADDRTADDVTADDRTADDRTADDVMSDGGETTDLVARATGRCLLTDT